ncbi:MASE3 domain-containing protein [Oceanibaculum indicum]|uniref:histidine kinase n=1 Tax=Oceanibaculum indicum TaxID=526216 RepID=A0A420WAW6_9PROT|nr:MASE3 domain-containing protein [Oceanibaculum indicum]RKQ68096.1 signal transduction histidine kinase [Oceanibaculum indicum]
MTDTPYDKKSQTGPIISLASLHTSGLVRLDFWSFPALLTLLLALVALYDFVIFHTLAELFAILVAFVMFVLAWHTSALTQNRFMLVLACGYFWIGTLDLAHTLAYKGLELLPYSGVNAAAQIWIVTRYFEAVLLLVAPGLAGYRISKTAIMTAGGAVSVALLAWVLSGIFPQAYVEGKGLTAFKIGSEFLIVALLVGAIWTLLHFRPVTEPVNLTLLVSALILTIFTELTFTVYLDPFGFANFTGHILKLLSFWLIFQAIIASNIERPYKDLQSALQQAQQSTAAAEKANKAKSDFLSMMSHDLRTPLNAVMGFSDMMRGQVLGSLGNPKYVEYSDAIHKSGAYLVSLINDILDVSKIESGHYELEEEELDLQEVIREIHVGVATRVPADSHALKIDMAADSPLLLADRRATLQILANLIGNATKFSTAGSDIRVSWKADDQGRWVLSITDTGCGIAADKLETIIEPFVQANPLVSRKHEGVGLGLHIVHLLAKLHDATLKISSVEGKGTTVSLAYPPERIVQRENRKAAG